jgi:DNA end-binding protein Ku
MVALGKVVFTSREHIIALEPRDKGMVGVTLRYPYEVRQADAYFEAIDDEKVPKDMLDLAIHIVDSKRGEFDPEKFEDHYENALKELLRKKQKGEKIDRPKEPSRTNVVNLMEALRQSVQASGGKQSNAARAKTKKGKKRIEGQREMLLPIPGKKDKEAAAARSTARPSGRHRKAG